MLREGQMTLNSLRSLSVSDNYQMEVHKQTGCVTNRLVTGGLRIVGATGYTCPVGYLKHALLELCVCTQITG